MSSTETRPNPHEAINTKPPCKVRGKAPCGCTNRGGVTRCCLVHTCPEHPWMGPWFVVGKIQSFLDRLTDEDWAGAAVIAGCRPPSAETRRVVAELVRSRDVLGQRAAS